MMTETEEQTASAAPPRRLVSERYLHSIVVFVVLTVVFSGVLIAFDLFEWFYEFSRQHEDWELDEIVLSAVAALFAAVISLVLLVRRDIRSSAAVNRRLRELVASHEEQRRFEVETRRIIAERDRLSAIGTMAGGFAHNFNNLLLPVLGLSQSVLDDLDETDPLRRDMAVIVDAARQAKVLVDTVLSQARAPEEGNNVRLSEALRNAAALARASLPSRQRLEVEVAADATGIEVPDSSLGAALLNLIGNARDAYGDRQGIILIETGRLTLRAPRLVGGTLVRSGDYLGVSVVDRAGGMSPETASKALTPFFTTKAAGVGTGLGLHNVATFARRYGGGVEILSEAGIGTRVEILLRLSADGGLEATETEWTVAENREAPQ
jgi:signal transduction histidine kinase